MPTPRKHLVDVATTPYYHCIARCVRRAFLCGDDRYTGQNFDHRKMWVKNRLDYLVSLFAIDVCAYAVMSNHLHLVVHVDAERAAAWSDDDVIARYTRLHPMAKAQMATLGAQESEREQLIALWRQRLSDLSWLMRTLCEHIARRANREDETRGRFWEGRFKSQALLDEDGLLTCMAYVDLNPVRAGICDTLDGSDFTSIQERLKAVATKKKAKAKTAFPATLAPFSDQTVSGQSQVRLPTTFDDYVTLLRWAGSQVKDGKRGVLRDPVAGEAPLPRALAKRGLSPSGFIATISHHAMATARALGSMESLQALADARGLQRVRGRGLAEKLQAA